MLEKMAIVLLDGLNVKKCRSAVSEKPAVMPDV